MAAVSQHTLQIFIFISLSAKLSRNTANGAPYSSKSWEKYILKIHGYIPNDFVSELYGTMLTCFEFRSDASQ